MDKPEERRILMNHPLLGICENNLRQGSETLLVKIELTKKELIEEIRSTRKTLKTYKKITRDNEKIIKKTEDKLESLSKKLETGRYYEED